MASKQPTNTRHIRADWVPHRIAAYVTHRYRAEACILCYLVIHLASDFIVSVVLIDMDDVVNRIDISFGLLFIATGLVFGKEWLFLEGTKVNKSNAAWAAMICVLLGLCMLGAIVPQLGQEKYGGSKNVSEDDALSIDLRSPNHDGRNQRECKGLGR